MDYLSRVHIRELEFLAGESVSLITIGKYEIRLLLSNLWKITVYSELTFSDPTGRSWRVAAEGSKHDCRFTDILEVVITRVQFEEPDLLMLEFADNSIVRIRGSAGGYEAFLLLGPDKQIYVFS